MHVLNGGSGTAGAKARMECTVNCRPSTLEVGGQAVIDIDAERMIRVVGGTDQMAALRGAIGL
jgi:phage tail tube protein FII